MENRKLYQGKDCPCPSDCQRHGNCKECIAFHHGIDQQTYCEFLYYGPVERDATGEVKSGKKIRLTDYGPCAG